MKKSIVILITIVLVIAVIGSCYALYTYRSDDILVDLTTETSVSLQITNGNGEELNLNTTEFNPNNPIITTVSLSHNKMGNITATGKGKFKISLTGYEKLIDYVDVVAKITNGNSYTLTELTQGVLIDLSKETNLTLKVYFKNISLDEYVTIANKTIYVTLTWTLSDDTTSNPNSPIENEVESGYYILGTFNNWEIDSAYKMETSTTNCIAQREMFDVQSGNELKVIKYDATTKSTTNLTLNTEYFMGTSQGENGTIQVTIAQPINIYVNSDNEFYITAVG